MRCQRAILANRLTSSQSEHSVFTKTENFQISGMGEMTGPNDSFHRLFPEARKNKLKTDLISTFPLPRDNINDKMER